MIIHPLDAAPFHRAHIRQRRKNGTHWKIKFAPHESQGKKEEQNAKKKKKEGRRIEERSQV